MTDEKSSLSEPLLADDAHLTSTESFLPQLKESKNNIIGISLESIESEENNQNPPASVPNPDATESSFERGEIQPQKYRDWPFGVLFHLQFIAVLALGGIYMKSIKTESAANTQGLDLMQIVVVPTLISAASAILLILLALVVLTRLGKAFITCSVWTSAIISLAIGLTALANGLVMLGVVSLLSALFGVCYAIAVRKRIPFAAANLSAGVSSIKSNGGIALVVLLISVMLFGWVVLWTTSLVGLMDIQSVCNDDNECDVQVKAGGWSLPWVFFLFWTQQVFKNVIHTTVAGLVGTWFFEPTGAASFCSSAVTNSFLRSVTYSFGSICFGSLCVAIVQTLDFIVNSLRQERAQNGESNVGVALLLCCLDCLLSLLEGFLEFFNKYAFVYVGVYGYPFITAGKKVMTLFKERGWTVIINDNLISNALGLMCFVVALLSGLVPFIFVASDESGGIKAAVVGIGFFVALLLSMTIMNIVDSAVTTILVCFAEAPEAFEANHSTHCRDMKEAWTKVYDIQF